MGTTFLPIRHAAIDGLGVRIVGRTSGISLNEQGRAQARCLARRLVDIAICAIYSSRRERAQETAAAISSAIRRPVHTNSEMDEVDYGEWTGREFPDLDRLPEWRNFNTLRDIAQIPRGESMFQLTQRAAKTITALCEEYPSDCIALVGHADWIRAAVASQLGLTIDSLLSFEVSPASVTALQVEERHARITRWNETGDLRRG